MKEKIKLVIVFILGIMISVVISVYAATVIGAVEVSYTPGEVSASNVQDAIDGTYTAANTLASNVTSLTARVSALESPIEKADFTLASGISKVSGEKNKIYYNKITKQVTINFSVTGTMSSGYVNLFTIVSKYRPNETVIISGGTGGGGYSQVRITSDGVCSIWSPNGATSSRGIFVYYTY